MVRHDRWRTWPHERQGEARPRIIDAQNIQMSGVCGEEQYGQEEWLLRRTVGREEDVVNVE